MESANGQSNTPDTTAEPEQPVDDTAIAGGGDSDPDEAPDEPKKPKLERLERADAKAKLAELRTAGISVLTAADILAADDFKYAVLSVPEWGGDVVIRGGTGTERDAFEASLVVQRGKHRVQNTLNIRAKLCQKAIVDPTDPELRRSAFTDKDIAKLGAKSAAALARVYDAAAELWGLTDEDVEELAGNSAAAATGA